VATNNLPAVDHYLTQEMQKRRIPNMAFGVVAGGRLIWTRNFGVRDAGVGDPITADTVFRIGSITKLFTGAAVLACRDAGLLSLDVPVSTYLPEFDGIVYPTSDSPRITVRHLITHSAGFPHDGPSVNAGDHPPTASEILKGLKGQKLDYAPGSKESYSNLGVGLAGLVVEKVSGERYRDFVAHHIFEPLGMTSTTFEHDAVPRQRIAVGLTKKGDWWVVSPGVWNIGAVEGFGGIYSTVSDMARFMAFELAAWPPRDGPDVGPIRRSTLREAQSMLASFTGSTAGGWGANFSVNWDPKIGRFVTHNGAIDGYGSAVYLAPERGIGIVGLLASRDAPNFDEMLKSALVLAATPPPAPPVAPVQPPR
jgi:CubicO group peptidase (beta-lactamase class C family)